MARRKTTSTTTPRRATRVKTGINNTTTNASDTAAAASTHRTADQPKGVLTNTVGNTTSSQPTKDQTNLLAGRPINLMPDEFEAVIGMTRLQAGIDVYEERQRELLRLEVEDPVGHCK